MKFKQAHEVLKSICCYKSETPETECCYLFCDLHNEEYLGNHKGGHVCLGCTLDSSVSKVDRFLTETSNLDLRDDDNIDYKNILRNSTEGKKLANSIIKGYKILLVHNPENKLEELLK